MRRARFAWVAAAIWLASCAASNESTSARGPGANAPDASTPGASEGDAEIRAPTNDDAGETPPEARDAATASQADAQSRGEPPVASEEVCGTGLDEDLDGLVDENCPCTPGTTQACYFGPKESAGELCPAGEQICAQSEFPAWGPCTSTGAAFPDDLCACFPEICGNDPDDNCNGQVDEGCAVDVPVDVEGDCVSARCPAWAPYPVGCDLIMEGGDSRGCVANAPGSSEVYFQEGDACPVLGGIFGGDSGHIGGRLLCSSQPGAPLDANNCAINKSEKLYPANADGCP